MDFVVDNYIWFIVGGVIILMAVIGFIAEKTNFGRKERPERPEKQKKSNKKEMIETVAVEPPKNVVTEEPILENGGQFDVIPELMNVEPKMDNPEPIDSAFSFPLPTSGEPTKEEDLYAGLDHFAPITPVTEEPAQQEDLYAGLGEIFQPETTTETETPVVIPELSEAMPLPDVPVADALTEPVVDAVPEVNLSVPTTGIDEVVSEEPVKNLEYVELEHPDLNLPALDKIAGKGEEPTKEEIAEEEDVWKF